MGIDIFGRVSTSSNDNVKSVGPAGVGFKFTRDGQYDMNHKRLCNLGEPTDGFDAISLTTMQHAINNQLVPVNKKIAHNNSCISVMESQRQEYETKQDIKQTSISELISTLETKVSGWEKIIDLQQTTIDGLTARTVNLLKSVIRDGRMIADIELKLTKLFEN